MVLEKRSPNTVKKDFISYYSAEWIIADNQFLSVENRGILIE